MVKFKFKDITMGKFEELKKKIEMTFLVGYNWDHYESSISLSKGRLSFLIQMVLHDDKEKKLVSTVLLIDTFRKTMQAGAGCMDTKELTEKLTDILKNEGFVALPARKKKTPVE